MTQYYTTMPRMQQRFDSVTRQMAADCSSRAHLERWQKKAREHVGKVLGLPTFEKVPLSPELLETMQMNGYTQQKVIIDTEPGIRMPVYVLIPEKSLSGAPAVIALHGHGGCKDVTAGVTDHPYFARYLSEHPRAAYGKAMCMEGFTVYCPDTRGFGERREWQVQGDDKVELRSCHLLNQMGQPLGQTAVGMYVWDLMRLLDYIVALKKHCSVSCIGMSGGGMQTIFFSALDDRIAATVTSGYFYGYKQALLEQAQNCSCNFVPHLWEAIDMGDIGCMIAPRPFLVESGNQDHLNGAGGIANVNSQVEIARGAYKIFKVEERLWQNIGEGGHLWFGNKTPEFLKKYLTA